MAGRYFLGGLLFLLSFMVLAADEKVDALARAEAVLMSSPVFGDQSFLLGQARRLRGLPPLSIDPEAILRRQRRSGVVVEYELWSLRNAEIRQGLPTLRLRQPDIGFVPERADALLRAGKGLKGLFDEEADKVLAVMKHAANCRPYMPPSTLGAAAYEYVATHQLFAAFWAFQKGCLSGPVYQERASLYATRVYSELLVTRLAPLSDLQVERMTMLCLVKLCQAIPADLIGRLWRAQQVDGMWRFEDDISPELINHEHATVMAYFTLVAYGL